MVLKILGSAANLVPHEYYTPTLIGVASCLALRAYARGRTTNRERDLHARVVILTGAFTPLGLTILQELAQRGAKVIALTPLSPDSEYTTTLISALRETTKNEELFAEQCDMHDLTSVRAFCTTFLTNGQSQQNSAGVMAGGGGESQRIDCLIFAHEYRHVGAVWGGWRRREVEERERREGAMGTFLMVTLLLPALLVAPAERDIRIVNVVNPLYAAAAPSFNPFPTTLPPPSSPPITTTPNPTTSSTFISEGTRSLRTAILTRHLQRVLDALPGAADIPSTDTDARGKVRGQTRLDLMDQQRSNIVAVSVSAGISRADTVAPWLRADRAAGSFSWVGLVVFILLQPILLLIFKSSQTAVQSVLHVLFLPTPFKQRSPAATTAEDGEGGPKRGGVVEDRVAPEEVLKPGALYADCAVVRVNVQAIRPDGAGLASAENEAFSREEKASISNGKGKQKEKQKETEKAEEAPILKPMPDDGELGGEEVGRLVWEHFEVMLKQGELDAKAAEKEAAAAAEAERKASEKMEASEPTST